MVCRDILNNIPDFLRIQGLPRPASTRRAHSLRHIILHNLPDCAVCQAIIALELLETDLGEFIQLAHDFFVFGWDLIAW